MIDNFSDESLTIPKKTVLGIAERIAEPLVNRINAESKSDTLHPLNPGGNERTRPCIRSYYTGNWTIYHRKRKT
jgi:hypothetical protein